MIVTIQKNINIPDSDYCNDSIYCEQIITSYAEVTWYDGLGSPGMNIYYYCNAFDTPLYNDYNKIKKCERCLQYNKK